MILMLNRIALPFPSLQLNAKFDMSALSQSFLLSPEERQALIKDSMQIPRMNDFETSPTEGQ